MKKKDTHGISHILSIFLLPALIMVIYFTPYVLLKIMCGLGIIGVLYYLWNYVAQE